MLIKLCNKFEKKQRKKQYFYKKMTTYLYKVKVRIRLLKRKDTVFKIFNKRIKYLL